MPFYQNPFCEEFRGSMVTGGERQMSLTFPVPAMKSSGGIWESYNSGPFDFSTYNTLTMNFAIDTNFRNYASVAVNVAGATPAATTADEVVALLNANTTFSDFFSASVKNKTSGGYALPQQGTQAGGGTAPPYTVLVRSKRDKTRIRAYFSNTGAEKLMRFNRWAGVAELPSYFSRHTVADRFNFTDGTANLILLDNTDAVYGQPIIADAGLEYTTVKNDWEFLNGRTVTFTFKKQTVDASSRVTQIIEYPAGARAGDLARMTKYTYTGAKTAPDTIAEIPYVLTTGDLITP